ncbi:uncharacterized protein TNCV_3520681 [Trichonephila clavipes]|nr:uncharacterized protein TNCV_3520681 [Trichonephila clavipes]
MMEAGWSARRVARQLGRSDCVVRRCWDQWIRWMSFTRRPGSRFSLQTSRQEDHHIVRNARVQQLFYHSPSRCAAIFQDSAVKTSAETGFNGYRPGFYQDGFNQNYGILGILDWLHETDKEYRKSELFERAIFYIPIDTKNINYHARLIWNVVNKHLLKKY